jgi:hypothetical protein
VSARQPHQQHRGRVQHRPTPHQPQPTTAAARRYAAHRTHRLRPLRNSCSMCQDVDMRHTTSTPTGSLPPLLTFPFPPFFCVSAAPGATCPPSVLHAPAPSLQGVGEAESFLRDFVDAMTRRAALEFLRSDGRVYPYLITRRAWL